MAGDYPNSARSERATACESCGRESCVHVLEGYSEQTPLFRSLCLQCAEHRTETPEAAEVLPPGRSRMSLAAGVIVAGVIVGAAGALADHFGIGGSSGFGLAQMVGVAVGGVCILVGAFLRVDALGILGGILFVASIAADVLSIGGRGGFGWKQLTTVAIGCTLAAVGMAWVFVTRRTTRDVAVSERRLAT